MYEQIARRPGRNIFFAGARGIFLSARMMAAATVPASVSTQREMKAAFATAVLAYRNDGYRRASACSFLRPRYSSSPWVSPYRYCTGCFSLVRSTIVTRGSASNSASLAKAALGFMRGKTVSVTRFRDKCASSSACESNCAR